MGTKEEINAKVYEPVRSLKQKFYDSKSQDEWDTLKEELKNILAVGKELMTPEFYEQYKDGVVNAIQKTYSYKEKQWNKKSYPVKNSFIFQDELAAALAEYIKIQTKIIMKNNSIV